MLLAFTTRGGSRSAEGENEIDAPSSCESISRLTIRPRGPLPCTARRSMLRSRAKRRTRGEERTRPPVATSVAPSDSEPVPDTGAGTGAGAGTDADTGADTGAEAEAEAATSAISPLMSSPAFPMIATGTSGSRVSPSGTKIFSKTPRSNDRNSIVALSVSTSARRSSTSTSSPSFLIQATKVPSSMVGESLGSPMILAIAQLA